MRLQLDGSNKASRDGFTVLGNELFGLLDTPEAQRVLRNRALADFAARPEIAALLNRYPKKRHERILLTEISKRGIDLKAEYRRVWDNIKAHVDMAQFVKHAQLKALEPEGIPEPRKGSFLNYDWYIDHQPLGSFVLGDVGPLARVADVDQLTFPYGLRLYRWRFACRFQAQNCSWERRGQNSGSYPPKR